jgi:hypothetical protein
VGPSRKWVIRVGLRRTGNVASTPQNGHSQVGGMSQSCHGRTLPRHSITSSARETSVGDTVRPID